MGGVVAPTWSVRCEDDLQAPALPRDVEAATPRRFSPGPRLRNPGGKQRRQPDLVQPLPGGGDVDRGDELAGSKEGLRPSTFVRRPVQLGQRKLLLAVAIAEMDRRLQGEEDGRLHPFEGVRPINGLAALED